MENFRPQLSAKFLGAFIVCQGDGNWFWNAQKWLPIKRGNSVSPRGQQENDFFYGLLGS